MPTKKVIVRKKVGAETKYTPEIVNKICALIVEDDYTTDEICKKVGIVYSSFFLWKDKHPEFSLRLKEAREKRLEVFRGAARSGLLQLLKGGTYEDVITDYKPGKDGNPTVKQLRRIKKVMQPNAIAAIFALKNTDSDVFADIDRKEIKVTGPVNITLEDL